MYFWILCHDSEILLKDKILTSFNEKVRSLATAFFVVFVVKND
jgi:hypothetical protein